MALWCGQLIGAYTAVSYLLFGKWLELIAIGKSSIKDQLSNHCGHILIYGDADEPGAGDQMSVPN